MMIKGREAWRKLFLDEPLEQEIWDPLLRGLRDLLIRLPDGDNGVILSRTDDPIGHLLTLLRVPPKRVTEVSDMLRTLARHGELLAVQPGDDGSTVTVWSGEHYSERLEEAGALVLPRQHAEHARRARSSAARARQRRNRRDP